MPTAREKLRLMGIGGPTISTVSGCSIATLNKAKKY